MQSKNQHVYERSFDADVGGTVPADSCPECDGTLETQSGETRCSSCGLIVNEYRVDHAAESISRDQRGQPQSRTGAPLTPARHDRGLSTEIGRHHDGNGNTLPGEKRRQLQRLRTHHSRARWRSKAERNLAHACGEIARITSALGLPLAAREEASVIYRRAMEDGLIPGRSIESMATASVFAACRCGQYGRQLQELVEVAQVDRQSIENAYRVLNTELGLPTKPPRPHELVPRLIAACELPQAVGQRAVELADLAAEAGLANGRQPSGVAGACLYQAAQEVGAPVTQAELADAAGTTPATIRARYKELQRVLA